ncbi:MAG: pirin family protein [Cellulophaga sp.]
MKKERNLKHLDKSILKLKTIKYVLPAEEVDMGGFPVKQPLPTQKIQQISPFLLLHHAHAKYSSRRPAKQQGIGPHPHRGFSPVTFIIEGEVHHRDSRGNNQIAKTGEVQWMHAGAGIVHSERPSEALVGKSGRMEIVQLWVNSPKEKKMIPPEYQYLPEKDIPIEYSEDGKIANKIIAGNYKNLQSAINTQSDLLILWGKAEKGGGQTIEIPTEFNSMLYLINGNMSIEGYGIIEKEYLAVFNEGGNSIKMTFNEDAQFLLLSGKSIEGKVAQQGPFVMNTQTEILEAMRDYKMGKMGVLIEDD